MARKKKAAPAAASAAAPAPEEEHWESAADVRETQLEWLWPQRIVGGALGCVEARKSYGKSTLLNLVASAITSGTALPCDTKQTPGYVLWYAGEEDYDAKVMPRHAAQGGNCRMLKFPKKDERGRRRRIVLPDQMGLLQEAVGKLSLSLIVLDPLVCFVSERINLCADQSIHAVLDPLADLAHSTGVTVLFSRHLTKNRNADVLDQGQGGSAVGGVARSILRVDHPDRRISRRVLRVIACNDAFNPPPLEYWHRGEEGLGIIQDARELKTEDHEPDLEDLDEGEKQQLEDARILLRARCSDKWTPVNDIIQEGKSAAISERTIRRAKAELGFDKRRLGKENPPRWEWGPVPPPPKKEGGGEGVGSLAPDASERIPNENGRKRKSKAAKGGKAAKD